MTRTTSVRLSEELFRRLDELSGAVDRPRAWLIEQAIARYLNEEAWQVAAIAEALDEYRGGKAVLIPHDQVMEELRGQIGAASVDADPLA
jgi:predicted transcriptional regulator